MPQDNNGVSARKRAGKEGKKEKICIGEKHGRNTSSMKKDQGVDIHQHEIEKIFYIIREVAPRLSASTEQFLVISNSPRCILGLFPSEVGSVWVCLHTEIQSGWITSWGRRRRTKEIRNVSS